MVLVAIFSIFGFALLINSKQSLSMNLKFNIKTKFESKIKAADIGSNELRGKNGEPSFHRKSEKIFVLNREIPRFERDDDLDEDDAKELLSLKVKRLPVESTKRNFYKPKKKSFHTNLNHLHKQRLYRHLWRSLKYKKTIAGPKPTLKYNYTFFNLSKILFTTDESIEQRNFFYDLLINLKRFVENNIKKVKKYSEYYEQIPTKLNGGNSYSQFLDHFLASITKTLQAFLMLHVRNKTNFNSFKVKYDVQYQSDKVGPILEHQKEDDDDEEPPEDDEGMRTFSPATEIRLTRRRNRLAKKWKRDEGTMEMCENVLCNGRGLCRYYVTKDSKVQLCSCYTGYEGEFCQTEKRDFEKGRMSYDSKRERIPPLFARKKKTFNVDEEYEEEYSESTTQEPVVECSNAVINKPLTSTSITLLVCSLIIAITFTLTIISVVDGDRRVLLERFEVLARLGHSIHRPDVGFCYLLGRRLMFIGCCLCYCCPWIDCCYCLQSIQNSETEYQIASARMKNVYNPTPFRKATAFTPPIRASKASS